MMEKMNDIGIIVLGFGIILMVAHLYDVVSIPYVYVPMIVIGLLVLIIPALKTKKHRSPLCRIGLHSFVHKHWDEEIKYMAIYECERCKKRKKVVRSAGG